MNRKYTQTLSVFIQFYFCEQKNKGIYLELILEHFDILYLVVLFTYLLLMNSF